jgi:DNA polymerase-1
VKLLSPATIRRCFIADPGHLILTADFDQIELRVAAALAGETKLIEAAKRGESLHKIAAILLFSPAYTPDEYRYTKNVNFGWLFGGGAAKLAEQAGISFEQAQMIINKYSAEFKALTAYKRKMQTMALKAALGASYGHYCAVRETEWLYRSDDPEGRVQRAALQSTLNSMVRGKVGIITTPTGRELQVDADRAYAATNYIVQSTARDIMAAAMLRVMSDEELAPTVLLPIHDELLGQAPKAKAERIAQRYGEIMSTELMGCPITATGKVYGKSWGHGYR